MKSDNYITRPQKPDHPNPYEYNPVPKPKRCVLDSFLRFRASLCLSCSRLATCLIWKHFAQNHKLGSIKKLSDSISPVIKSSFPRVPSISPVRRALISLFRSWFCICQEINASKCFVMTLIENYQNQDDIDRFFDVLQNFCRFVSTFKMLPF